MEPLMIVESGVAVSFMRRLDLFLRLQFDALLGRVEYVQVRANHRELVDLAARRCSEQPSSREWEAWHDLLIGAEVSLVGIPELSINSMPHSAHADHLRRHRALLALRDDLQDLHRRLDFDYDTLFQSPFVEHSCGLDQAWIGQNDVLLLRARRPEAMAQPLYGPVETTRPDRLRPRR